MPAQMQTPRQRCSSCVFLTRCLPARLDATQTQRFEQTLLRTRTLAAGEHLYRIGDPFQYLYAIQAGSIKSYADDAGGREHVMNFHFAGETLGADAIYPDRHGGNAVALTDCTICCVPFNAFTQLTREIPELQQQMLRLLSRELFSMMSIAGDYTAEERLAAFLIMVGARQHGMAAERTTVELPMSRQDIANYLRLATETVSRILARFQKKGLVRADRRHITLTDAAGLYQIAECMNPYARTRLPRATGQQRPGER